MATKIRLQRHGKKRAAFYHVVIADERAKRDGKFIEKIGTYNPNTDPATIDIKFDRALYWVKVGAQPTDTARAILRFKGIMYKKHLHRGVKKGALSQEEADTKYQEWIDAKDDKIAARFRKTAEEKRKRLQEIAGVVIPKDNAPIDASPAASEEEE